MNESFSFQRYFNLFQWQMPRMQPLRYIFISIVLIFSSYMQTMMHYERLNSFSDKFIVFIFIIVICTNFYRQMTLGDSFSNFLLLPSSKLEKFLFLMTSVVIIPILLLVVLVKGGDLLARTLHDVPATYSYMNLQMYLAALLLASITFFVYCLPQKKWTIGASSLFVLLLIPLFITAFSSKVAFAPIISDILLIMNQPPFMVVITVIVIFLAYVFFKRNEVSRFKKY